MNPVGQDGRLTVLFENHHAELLAYCTRRIGRTDADDVVSDVFAVAWKRLDEIEWDTARPWLYGIARGVLANRWRTVRRQRRLRERLSALVGGSAETPDIYVVRRDDDNEVIHALKRLTSDDQEILMLAAWEELSAPGIARALDISVSAAEKRLTRAKQRFAKVLGPTRFPKAASIPAGTEGDV